MSLSVKESHRQRSHYITLQVYGIQKHAVTSLLTNHRHAASYSIHNVYVKCHTYSAEINKKAQLSLTNPRDACEKFARFTYSPVEIGKRLEKISTKLKIGGVDLKTILNKILKVPMFPP